MRRLLLNEEILTVMVQYGGWGSRALVIFITSNNLCLFPFFVVYSVVDLVSYYFPVFLNFTWKVCEDSCGRDCLPVVFRGSQTQHESFHWWRLSKASWKQFWSLCLDNLLQNSAACTADCFADTVITVVEQCVPSTPKSGCSITTNN